MAVVSQTQNIPLATGYPMPTRYFEEMKDRFHFEAAVYTDNASGWQPRGTILHFPGSGAVAYPGVNTAFCAELVTARRFRLVSFAPYGVEGSSLAPFRYNYGNTSAPHFTALWCKLAWEVQSCVEAFFSPGGDGGNFVILGHSRGATSALAWAANYTGEDAPPPDMYEGLRGIIAAGATQGGLGGFRWNDLNRNMNAMSNLWHLNAIDPTILAYGGNDDYAPPDYVKRLQQVIPPEKETYVMTPGPDVGHQWITTVQYAPLVGMWAEQMMLSQTITQVDGVTPAVPGPVVN